MESRDGTALAQTAQVMRAERTVYDVVLAALSDFLGTIRDRIDVQDAAAGIMTEQQAWAALVDEKILPALRAVYERSYATPVLTAAAVPVEPGGLPDTLLPFLPGPDGTTLVDRYASDYLAGTARNRLVGVADTVFSEITTALNEGRHRVFDPVRDEAGNVLAERVGESIPQLSARVDDLLADGQRWKGRATTIARTEVISAHNAGYQAAAANVAAALGVTDSAVAKEWLATSDARTRPSHADADGQVVMGLDAPFTVGGSAMRMPGDVSAPADEVINCRCVVLYHYPGDPAYPADLAPATMTTEPVPSGMFSAEQYASMAPESSWSAEKQAAIKASLSATPQGKALHEVLDRFQDGGSIARLRTSIEKRLAGETLPDATMAKVDALLDGIKHAPTDWAPETLYRGMTVKGKLDNVMAKYVPGEPLDLSLTSFSTDRKIAVKFQGMTAKGVGNETRVMVELVGDNKRVLPIQNLARDARLFKEKEWVTAGRFRILEVKKSPSGGIILRVQQEATL